MHKFLLFDCIYIYMTHISQNILQRKTLSRLRVIFGVLCSWLQSFAALRSSCGSMAAPGGFPGYGLRRSDLWMPALLLLSSWVAVMYAIQHSWAPRVMSSWLKQMRISSSYHEAHAIFLAWKWWTMKLILYVASCCLPFFDAFFDRIISQVLPWVSQG